MFTDYIITEPVDSAPVTPDLLSSEINIFDLISEIKDMMGSFGLSFCIIALVIGILGCFLGFRLTKFFVGVCGFFIGLISGGCLALKNGSAGYLIFGLILAIVLAIFSYKLYKVGVFIISFFNGGMFSFIAVLMIFNKLTPSLIVACAVGVITGIVSVIFTKPTIIISTSVSFGSMSGIFLAVLLSSSVMSKVLPIIFIALGLTVQILTNNGLFEGNYSREQIIKTFIILFGSSVLIAGLLFGFSRCSEKDNTDKSERESSVETSTEDNKIIDSENLDIPEEYEQIFEFVTEPTQTAVPTTENIIITSESTLNTQQEIILKPTVSAYIEEYKHSYYDQIDTYLIASGDFSYIKVAIYPINHDDGRRYYTEYSAEECRNPVLIQSYSADEPHDVEVIPFDKNGISGDKIICHFPDEISGIVTDKIPTSPVDNMKGQINCQGEIVSGYTTDYICHGGSLEAVRQSLGDNWHVTAKNKCYNNGYWYELWDSDDGDYYGWVNEKYINFNNEIQSSNEGVISSVDNAKGQINCHGGVVAGFTTSYVCENGKASTVRKSLGDKWHITAKNSCYSHGVLWYELWDTDDGDYYGWVDSNYIDFY